MCNLKFKEMIFGMCVSCLLCTGNANAQNNDGNTYHNKEKVATIPLKDRFAFKTNILGWVLATPNLGIQFDVSAKEYNKWTIGADFKWNPGNSKKTGAEWNYEILEAKLEARKYFRNKTAKPGSKRTPKYWRAYYWGVYANYSDYTVLLNKGYEGQNIGIGATAGWEVPLYKYKNGALDIDMGISAGWIYGKSNRLKADGETINVTNVKDWHIRPYPVISEIKIALVYRFKSVKEKYKKSKL